MRKRAAAGAVVAAVILGALLFFMPGGPQIVTRPAETPAPETRAPGESGTADPAIVLPGTPPAAEAPESFAETPVLPPIALLLVPVEGVGPRDLADTWGDARGEARAHQGLDIPAPVGTPVVAADSGTILKFFDSEDGGTAIYQSDSTGDYVFYYAHLERRAPGLAEGAAVAAGQIIGYVGTSGNAADDAPHLHFEIAVAPEDRGWTGGEPINPYDVLTRR